MNESASPKVCYIYSRKLLDQLDKNNKIRGRSELVNSLIESYDLLDHNHINVISPAQADERTLKLFHSQEYLDHLKRCSSEDLDEEKMFAERENEGTFGIGYDDCPLIDNVWDFARTVGGASLTAAHLVNIDAFKYAINWFGGWHHAKRDQASGFCYVNDINLCISKLRHKFSRILYLDLDMHHGDGVQEAFEYTNKVMTVSFHKFMPGFFPGTGHLDEIGKGNGKYFNVNVPLLGGCDDRTFQQLFTKIFDKIISVYKPEVIVTQCGADALFGDPIDELSPFNLTDKAYSHCVKNILATDVPTVFLGGGGYNFANTARLWCLLTSLIVGAASKYQQPQLQLDNDIPEHDNFLKYGPDYELATQIGGKHLKNKNSEEYVNKIATTIIDNLGCIRLAEK